MTKPGIVVAGLVAALLLGACATTTDAPVKAAEGDKGGSGFLSKDYARLTPGDINKNQAGLRYFNPSAQWRQYSKIIVDPVTFWGDEIGKISPADQQALSTYFNGALEKAFGE